MPAFSIQQLTGAVNQLGSFVRGLLVNGTENFWSLFKRGINGTYVSVEPFHLFRCLDEQSFRYNDRTTPDNPIGDYDRFKMAMSQIVGKRLTWNQLPGKQTDGQTCIN